MVKQHLVSNFNTILRAKTYFFLKKSIWKYLILTCIMGFLQPINTMSPLASALLYFVGIMIILWPLQVLSAKTLGKSINFDALVEFNDPDIIIHHNNKDSIETKDWNWVKTIEIKKDRIWLTLNLSRPFGISIPKSELDQSQIEFFELMKKMKNDKK